MNKPVYFIILWILIISGCFYFWFAIYDLIEMYRIVENSKAFVKRLLAK